MLLTKTSRKFFEKKKGRGTKLFIPACEREFPPPDDFPAPKCFGYYH